MQLWGLWTFRGFDYRGCSNQRQHWMSLITARVSIFLRSQPKIMDQVMQFVEPGRQFIKDSVRLVKRCTKPDRKGIVSTLINLFRTRGMKSTTKHTWCRLLLFDNNLIFPASRIPEDSHGYRYWICHHGLHRFLCQTHSHPHQQHHCVSTSIINNCMIYILLWNCSDFHLKFWCTEINQFKR